MTKLRTSAKTTTVVALAGVVLAGCAAEKGKYPSLAVRDAERVTGQLTPTQPDDPPAVPTRPANESERIGDSLTIARNAFDKFQAEENAAGSLIQAASDDPASEDKRSRALVAIASLSSLRGQTVQALAQLDQMEAEAASTFAPLEDIQRAQFAITHLLDQQDATLARLASEMNQ